MDSLQNIIVGNYITGDIVKINPEGKASLLATILTVVNQVVIGYITVFEGYIYATGARSHIIYRVSLDGNIEDWAGSGLSGDDDGSLANASFSRPNGIGIEKVNKILYISGGNGHLRYIELD